MKYDLECRNAWWRHQFNLMINISISFTEYKCRNASWRHNSPFPLKPVLLLKKKLKTQLSSRHYNLPIKTLGCGRYQVKEISNEYTFVYFQHYKAFIWWAWSNAKQLVMESNGSNGLKRNIEGKGMNELKEKSHGLIKHKTGLR